MARGNLARASYAGILGITDLQGMKKIRNEILHLMPITTPRSIDHLIHLVDNEAEEMEKDLEEDPEERREDRGNGKNLEEDIEEPIKVVEEYP